MSAQESEETRMMGLPGGRRSFKIGLAVLIQYRRVTSSHPASQPRCRSIYRAYYVAQVKLEKSKIKTVLMASNCRPPAVQYNLLHSFISCAVKMNAIYLDVFYADVVSNFPVLISEL